MKKTLFLLLILELMGCDTLSRKLKLVNNSNGIKYSIIMLDTTIDKSASPDLTEISPNQYVEPSLVAGEGDDVWEYTINKYSIDSTLYIYFFETNKLSDSIILEKRYKRLDLRVKDLEKLHWIVSYR